eukprot:CAMPEP_0175964082 /NCGR_PEP_ID=MMETSP0108-20121206/37369_1 /TAXON_ID=195067 ORGANISM="Goniomonas pacifica, Strain CCMP1869" /NCGR_SAMPLE_ID=MMETSP0108 /ASSEMBLY_ACC=CAM_ASM_000204 /LENGTH=76 /DNA_ID=CAMNT_0017292035 /DNA_START=79 /DNA_END=309 /DNA_ORIENTATION=-
MPKGRSGCDVEGCLADEVRSVDVSSRPDQHLANLHVAPASGHMQRCVFQAVRHVDVGPRPEQHPDHVPEAIVGCQM